MSLGPLFAGVQQHSLMRELDVILGCRTHSVCQTRGVDNANGRISDPEYGAEYGALLRLAMSSYRACIEPHKFWSYTVVVVGAWAPNGNDIIPSSFRRRKVTEPGCKMATAMTLLVDSDKVIQQDI